MREELESQGRFYGLDRRTVRTRASELLEQLDLDEQAERDVARLSGGQRRRLDVAMGLIHRPQLLFLDEPSAGLDPQSRANLLDHIRRLHAEEDVTVVLTTHYLDEADAVAGRVIVIDHGQIIADGTPDELKSRVSGDLITMNTLASVGTVFHRELRAKMRTPWPFVESFADPLLLLVLFGPLVAGLGTVPGMPPGDTVQWFVPGILVLMAFATSAFIGSGIQEERQAGSLERMLVTPVSRVALLLGRVLRVVVVVIIQALVVVVATLPFGLRVHAEALAVALVQLGTIAAVLGIASLTIGLVLENSYAFWGVMTLLYMPIFITSGALLPMNLAPDWLYAISRLNPLAHVVDAQRVLFSGVLADPAVVLGFIVALAFGAVVTAVGVRAMARIRL